jgi:hypothetical protein
MLEDRTCPADRRQVLNMTGVHRRRCQGEVRAVTPTDKALSLELSEVRLSLDQLVTAAVGRDGR